MAMSASHTQPSEDEERRVNLLLLEYWETIRGDRPFPHENDIDPEAIASMWDNCFLIQVRDIENVEDYNYTYLGNNIRKAYNEDGISEDNGCVVSPNANRLSHSFKTVLEMKRPLITEGEFENAQGVMVSYRQALLPLGTEGVVESILGAMRVLPVKR